MTNPRSTVLLAALAALGLAACGTQEKPAHDVEPPGDTPAQAQSTAATATEAIAAFERNFGVHAGLRRNHTKGVCAAGEFIGDPAARTISRAALFSGTPVPVLARFSLPGGNPEASDASPTPRGMALEFRLPDGSRQHMTMLNVPVFSAATPQSFLDGLLAATPDPATGKPDPERVRAYRESHPDAAPQAKFMRTYRPPASYANSRYYGIHAFRFTNAEGVSTPVRWQFEPEDGERALEPAEMDRLPKSFLAQRLAERAARGPIRWQMRVILGQPGDPTNDPTLAWPASRASVIAGTLSLTAVGPQAGGECEAINFDPMVMTDGIGASDDPILAFRSPAYALSFARRMSEAARSQAPGVDNPDPQAE